MPSTRKQKAEEKRSRQLDIMSDVENVDIIIVCYSRDEDRNNQSEDELSLDSGSGRPQKSSIIVGEDFRSLLNTNSRENSEMTIETTMMICEGNCHQMSRKLIKSSPNSQIQNTISTANAEKILSSIQITLSMQGKNNFTVGNAGPVGYKGESVGGCFLRLLEKYLKDLKRFVRIGNIHSSTLNITSSVPQGSFIVSIRSRRTRSVVASSDYWKNI